MERGGWNRGRGRGRDGGGRGGRGGHQQHQQWRGSRPGGPWDRQQQQPQGVGIVASGPPMGQVVEPASWGRSGEGSSSAAGRGGRGPAWRGGAGQLQWVGAGSPTPTAAAPPVQRPPPISPEPIPDPVVREMQSMSISENLTTPPEDSKRILPVKRPDKGGALAVRTSRLRVNHFPINFTPETVIMHYDLDVKLEVPLKNRRPVRISKADLSVVRSKLSSDDPVRFPLTKTAYDGEKNIFSAVLLPTGKFNVQVPEGEDAKGGSYVVTIKLVNELKLCKLKDYLSGYLSSIPRDILQGLDLVMKENPARNMVSVGRSFFPREPREGDDLGWGIMASRGFQHSLKPTSQGLAMCLDYSVLAFRKPFPVIDFLRERISQFDILNFQRFRAAVVEELKDLKVTVTHRKTKQKYIIKGLTSENTRRISFDEEDPEGKNPTRKVSIVDYFRFKYGKDIGYKDIPCLDLGRGNKKNYVPMEFCILVEGQRFPKEDLDRNAAIMLKNMSLVRPNDREREICSMVRSKDGPLGGGMAQNFGMEVNMNMTKVTGRIIGPPELKLGASNGKTIKVMVEREKCQWNLVGKSVVEGKSIGRWGVIDFSSSDRSRLNPDFFIPKLINRCGNLGIRMEEPLIYQCTTMSKFSRFDMLCELLESIKKEAYRICKGNLQILLCVMSRRDPGYKYLKWISETQLGIVTQCCLSTCANKANDQYLANLAIKINAKLGGSNVELNNPLPCFEGKGHVMFVGADVNHPAARNTTSPSIAAVVATMNWPAANRYVARVCPQVHRKEKILNFGDMCLELVERYAQLNNVRPDKIVIFRDGVSEGQFDMVLNEELLDLNFLNHHHRLLRLPSSNYATFFFEFTFGFRSICYASSHRSIRAPDCFTSVRGERPISGVQMGSVSEEEEYRYGSDQDQSERCGSYSLSADVSESESCSSFSSRRFDAEVGASSSMTSSPRPVAGNFGFTAPMMLPVIGGKDVVLWDQKPEKREADFSEVEMMKERFAKLLLGEDMSGGGKGVCTALAISNAITNLSATVFGELWRLEPLALQKKAMWRREMELLLCVSDSIVELVPSIQQFPGGGTYEVMETRPRSDLYMNLPALKKLDAMLLSMLDGFCDTEFWYVDRGIVVGETNDCDAVRSCGGRPSVRQEEKWWLPCPKVQPCGLSEDARKRLQQCRDCANQILKAALAINSSVLAEMEIPSAYLETLPKSGKTCLGEIIYRYITADQFSSEHLLDCLDLSSEHHTLEIANRIEAAIHFWKQKDLRKHNNRMKSRRSSWGGKVKGLVADADKNIFLAQRAETLLQSLRVRFPGLPQTALDMNKIQYNKDVGQSILESYSRVMESLAFNIIARIDDVLYVDDATKQCAAAESMSIFNRGGLGGLPIQKRLSPSPFSIHQSPYGSPFATPTFCSSTPVMGSPVRDSSSLRRTTLKEPTELKSEKAVAADFERVWSYAGNLSARRVPGTAPERD